VAEAANTGQGTPSWDTQQDLPWNPTSQLPAIGVSFDSLSFEAASGSPPEDQAIALWNSGNGTLNYTISTDAGWLSASPSTGTSTSQSDEQPHNISVDIAGLAVGSYSGTITISDPYATNNPQRIRVALNVYTTLPAKLAFSQQPTSTVSGATITPAVTVEIQDASGNLVTIATSTVTLSLLNANGSTLGGTLSKAAVAGVATFDNLSVDKAGTGYALRANSGSLTEVDSDPFNISAGVAARVQVETAADGSGTIVPAQDVPAGSMISVYAVSRDAGGNFIANVQAEWSFAYKTGGVADTDLAPWEGETGAFFTGNLAGTAQIRAEVTGLISVDSGVLTVILASLSLTVSVSSDNSFDVIVDGLTIDTIPDYTTRTYPLSQLVGSHEVILRAKSEEDTFVSAGMIQNDSADYLFSTASTSNGIWDTFSFTETEIHGSFQYEPAYDPPHTGDFSFTYTITYRSKETYIEKYEFVTKWGTLGSGNGQFYWPKGVAVDSIGHVLVSDTANGRMQKFTSTGDFQGIFGESTVSYPEGIVIGPDGSIYVADAASDNVHKFTSDGTFIKSWGGEGSGDGQLNQPEGIAVDSSGNVYVADFLNYRVQKFDSEGTFLTKWGEQGTGDGQFAYAYGIAVDSSGNVYVADSENHRIQKFTSTGTFLKKWGTSGSGDGRFLYPFGIVVDRSDFVYVADTHNHRMQKFTAEGIFLTKWGSEGDGDGQFNMPYKLAVDKLGCVYVADTLNNRIQKFQKKYE